MPTNSNWITMKPETAAEFAAQAESFLRDDNGSRQWTTAASTLLYGLLVLLAAGRAEWRYHDNRIEWRSVKEKGDE